MLQARASYGVRATQAPGDALPVRALALGPVKRGGRACALPRGPLADAFPTERNGLGAEKKIHITPKRAEEIILEVLEGKR